MKQASGVRSPQGVQSELSRAVADILADQQRIIEEYLLSLALADLVLFGALARIAFVPIEPFDLIQVQHCLYIIIIYRIGKG